MAVAEQSRAGHGSGLCSAIVGPAWRSRSVRYTIGFVGWSPVGVLRLRAARASASQHAMPENSPSATASGVGGQAGWPPTVLYILATTTRTADWL